MSRAGINGDLVNHLFNFPESFEKLMFPSQEHESNENKGVLSIPVDILDTPKEYIFFMDVPGLSKSDIQVCLSFPPSYIPMFYFTILCAWMVWLDLVVCGIWWRGGTRLRELVVIIAHSFFIWRRREWFVSS